MREILFRGKTTKDKEWVYGDLLHDGYDYDVAIWEQKYKLVTEISPETVGQFTGLTDKNGKKIFEGDIVKDEYYSNRCGVVSFGKGTFDSGIYCYNGWHYEDTDGIVDHNELYVYDARFNFEVIGNIHDNPELLGGAEDET